MAWTPSAIAATWWPATRTPCCEQVGAYLEAGLDGLVFNMHDAQDLEPVRLAGETLTKAFG